MGLTLNCLQTAILSQHIKSSDYFPFRIKSVKAKSILYCTAWVWLHPAILNPKKIGRSEYLFGMNQLWYVVFFQLPPVRLKSKSKSQEKNTKNYLKLSLDWNAYIPIQTHITRQSFMVWNFFVWVFSKERKKVNPQLES